MKKDNDKIKSKSIDELNSEIKLLQGEIDKLKMEKKINPAKDTNLIAKKKKQYARILTAQSDKKIVASL